MNAELLERILACPTLPSLPAVAARIVTLTRKPDVSLDELARTIQNDQALAAKVLRTVNSSAYGLRKSCSSVNQALVLLGLSTVKSLALGFSLVSALDQPTHAGFDLTSYWRRGLFTAIAARSLAEIVKRKVADEALLGGLLQDIGMIAMHRALGDRYEAIVTASGHHRRLALQELAAFELQHPDIGAMLAERWGFPPELVMPVKFHERPTAAPPAYADIVRCVGLGNMAHDVLTDADPARATARFRAHALDWFALDGTAANAVLARVSASATEYASLFKVHTGDAPDAAVALQRAAGRDTPGPEDRPGGLASTAGLAALVTDADRIDPLIGALGREACLRLGQDLFFGAQSQGRPLAVIALAIDRFGDLVREHGLGAGDAALVEAVALLAKRFEPGGGIIGRYGEATLILAIPGLSQADAVRTASTLRTEVAAASANWGLGYAGRRVAITVSVGATAYEAGAPGARYSRASQLFAAAAQACASASAAGGNCVRAFVPKAAA